MILLSLADQDINKIDRLACSHRRAWELYVESVKSPKGAFASGACIAGSGVANIYTESNCSPTFFPSNMGFYSRESYPGGTNFDYYAPTTDGSTGKYSIS